MRQVKFRRYPGRRPYLGWAVNSRKIKGLTGLEEGVLREKILAVILKIIYTITFLSS